ncbi:MAG TPA: M15 family metallopeptidase [Daejeonella sp.]
MTFILKYTDSYDNFNSFKVYMLLKSLILTSVGLLFIADPCFAQSGKPNKYGIQVESDPKVYRKTVEHQPMHQLMSLPEFIPGIVLDIRYATSNNFMRQPMYKEAAAYLRLPAAEALKAVQADLKELGLGLKIFDGYRPYAVTVDFYEKVRDSVFVASPKRGSKHNRGCAVDLTIINLESGKELIMPTPYDDFTPKAHTDYSDLPEEAIRNRELLKRLMVKHGFDIYADEWWHYDFKDWNEYPLMDISFEDLRRVKRKSP